jgi:hypothetical protein
MATTKRYSTANVRAERPRFADAYHRFLAAYSLAELGFDRNFFKRLRDRGAGREVAR